SHFITRRHLSWISFLLKCVVQIVGHLSVNIESKRIQNATGLSGPTVSHAMKISIAIWTEGRFVRVDSLEKLIEKVKHSDWRIHQRLKAEWIGLIYRIIGHVGV